MVQGTLGKDSSPPVMPQANPVACRRHTLPYTYMAPSVAVGTKSYRQVDKAKDPLFSWVKPEVFQRPTFKTFVALLDNYESETGVAEEVTPEEVRENWRFIDAIISTKVLERGGAEHHMDQSESPCWFAMVTDYFFAGDEVCPPVSGVEGEILE